MGDVGYGDVAGGRWARNSTRRQTSRGWVKTAGHIWLRPAGHVVRLGPGGRVTVWGHSGVAEQQVGAKDPGSDG